MNYSKTFKTKPTSYYRNKADKLLQEIGRNTFDNCLVCGGEYSCLHHYHPKSQSTTLRYDMENCIPVCVRCHFRHHNGDPIVHQTVLKIKGQDWGDKLNEKKKKGIGCNFGKKYFMDKMISLSKIT